MHDSALGNEDQIGEIHSTLITPINNNNGNGLNNNIFFSHLRT